MSAYHNENPLFVLRRFGKNYKCRMCQLKEYFMSFQLFLNIIHLKFV